MELANSEKNECQTLLRYAEDRTPIYKNKKKYETHDLAVKACKVLNSKPSQINKLVTYKCKVCHTYHIGRNGKTINKKYRKKVQTELNPKKMEPKFKIIGKIKL